MKKKYLLVSLIGLALPLTSCGLFNDADLAYENHYTSIVDTHGDDNPNALKVHGVPGTTTVNVENTLMFKEVYYGDSNKKITNTYKTGGVNENQFNVNNNQDYDADYDENVYDLYVPNSALNNKDAKHTVLLFIHGGSWVSGNKEDVNSYVFTYAAKGYISATIDYTLLDATSIASEDASNREKSIFRDLDEIDACISSIKSGLVEIGFKADKLDLVITGASSGSHLTMLYTYSRGTRCPLPIKFIVNAVGPVDIKPNAWKKFITADDAVLTAGITKEAIALQSPSNIEELSVMGLFNWNEYQTMRIANGMCGFPGDTEQIKASANAGKTAIENPNAATEAMTNVGGGQDQLSVTYWIKETNKVPMICAYGGKDSIVGINQYATLQAALEGAGYNMTTQHKFVYFKNCNHTDIDASHDATAYADLIEKIDNWLAAETIG